MTLEQAINICKEIIKTNMFNRNTDAVAIEEVLNTMYKSIEESAYYRDLVKLKEKEKQNLKKSLKGQIAVKDTEINKLKEKISKAIGHIEACKTTLGNYILSPNETECLLNILSEERRGEYE